jgi:hypothetical protein
MLAMPALLTKNVNASQFPYRPLNSSNHSLGTSAVGWIASASLTVLLAAGHLPPHRKSNKRHHHSISGFL